jgi:hypothetical protein
MTYKQMIHRQANYFAGNEEPLRSLSDKPPAVVSEISRSEVVPPFTVEVEQDCEECGGTGTDPGSLNPWDGEPCRRCRGAKREFVIRQYLAEAFRIAAGESNRVAERAHLVALTQYARQTVNALLHCEDGQPPSPYLSADKPGHLHRPKPQEVA